MAPIDLAALGEQITATVERAKAEDPRALHRTIDDLQRQLANRPAPAPPQRVEVPVLDAATREDLRTAMQTWEAATGQVRSVLDAIGEQLTTPAAHTPAAVAPDPPVAAAAVRAPITRLERTAAGNGALPKAQRAILSVLAQHGRRSTVQVALLTGYSSKSGGFRNTLSSLRSAELIEGRGDVEITQTGLQALGPYEPLPVGEQLVQWWKREQLGKAESAILDVLVEHWPDAVPVEVIAEATGYSATSGGFRNALSRLRSLQLAAGRGELRISDTLM